MSSVTPRRPTHGHSTARRLQAWTERSFALKPGKRKIHRSLQTARISLFLCNQFWTAGRGAGGGDPYGAPRLCGLRPWSARWHERANRRWSVPGGHAPPFPGRTRVCARTAWGPPGCRYGLPETEPDRRSPRSERSAARLATPSNLYVRVFRFCSNPMYRKSICSLLHLRFAGNC